VDVESTGSGEGALSKIKARLRSGIPMFMVMFIDYSMPGMTGPELAIEVRRLLQDTLIEVPYMCCCTAYTNDSFREAAM